MFSSALGLGCCLPANRSRLSTHRPIMPCPLAIPSSVPNRPPRVLVLDHIDGYSSQVNNVQGRWTLLILRNTPLFPRKMSTNAASSGFSPPLPCLPSTTLDCKLSPVVVVGHNNHNYLNLQLICNELDFPSCRVLFPLMSVTYYPRAA